jgi:2-amino-4-hydroxy-6-hydroxymethyldihydropteridine diphosphokinase
MMGTPHIDEGVLACIGMGANLGDAQAALKTAESALAALSNTRLLAVSPVYRSAPIDASGPDYFNAVALLRTSLDAHALLRELQRIELEQGRERKFHNAPRTLDLDLLLYGDEIIRTPALSVPHPRMHERAFVLRPLLDLLPSATIPGLGAAGEWLHRVAGQRINPVHP